MQALYHFIQSFDNATSNLAMEEWIFNHFDQEAIRLWVNPASVIVGKHQNALSECHFLYCKEAGIPVIRRISGGGTVYHDPGNVNFSFFRSVKPERMIDYDSSLGLIYKALRSLGYPVEMNERHDLFLDGFKISGNAQHLKKGRSLHHGTLLYDADLDQLRSAIKRPSGAFTDKSVRSVRSPIANLRTYLDLGSTEQFIALLSNALTELGVVQKEAPAFDSNEIDALEKTKYRESSWNFGYSPNYHFEHEIDGLVLEMDVARGGNILSMHVTVNGVEHDMLPHLLLEKRHDYDEISEILTRHYPSEQKSQFLRLLF